MKKVVLTWDSEQNPVIRVEGCTGPECAALTAPVEKRLFSNIISDEKSAEFYQDAELENTLDNKF